MESLLKLHRVDMQLRGLRSRLESAKRHLQAQERQLSEIEHRMEELRVRKRHCQASIHTLETEAGSLDVQLEKFRRDLNSSSTNKQYTAVLTELNTVKAARSKLDDQMLEEMDQVEDIDREIAEVKAQHEERSKVRELATEKLREREEEIGERLAELEREREMAAADVPAAEMVLFEEIADQHNGEAMASIEEVDRRHREYACSECNIHLPFEQVCSLMVEAKSLVRCPACGRILYLQEEIRSALAPS